MRYGGARRVRWSTLAAALLCTALLASCSASPSTAKATDTGLYQPIEPTARSGVATPPTQGPQGASLSEANGVQLSVIKGILHNSPIVNGDFADPYAFHDSAGVFVYATNTTTAHIPVMLAGTTANYTVSYLGDALPTLPKWTAPGMQWHPAVWERSDGTYVLYYATPDMGPSQSCIAVANVHHVTDGLCDVAWSEEYRMCISAATSTSPAGPFVDNSTGPFICPTKQGGAIDPSVFVTASGTPYILWKSDGDCCKLPTHIYSQQLAADGLTTVGPPHELIGATQPWEANLVEGPSMMEANGTYWLFYSANDWDTPNYAIGLAHCTSVTGPCTKPLDHAWLSSSTPGQGQDQGPGGEELVSVGGTLWMIHHGWLPGQAGTPGGQRRLYVALIAFSHGMPVLAPPQVSAALAALYVAYGNPSMPADSPTSFQQLVHQRGAPLAADSIAQVMNLGTETCADLAKHQSMTTIGGALSRQHLSEYESELVVGGAAEYLCPAYSNWVLAALRATLDGT